MDKRVRDKEALVDAIAELDPQYNQMLKKCALFEKNFDEALLQEQHDAAWDFVMFCEDMSHYVLQLACKYMEFPDMDSAALDFSDDYEQQKATAKTIAQALLKKEATKK